MRLLVVGRIGHDAEGKRRGAMAKYIIESVERDGVPTLSTEGAPFHPAFKYWVRGHAHETIVVNFSETQLRGTLEECAKYQLPLIHASSAEKIPDIELTFPVIEAPNLAIASLILFDVFPRLGTLLRRYGAKSSVAEAHHEGKTSPPITAEKLADDLGVPHSEIVHLREDRAATAFLGVPPESYGGYAIHRVMSKIAGGEIVIDLKHLGKEAYYEGLKLLATKMVADYGRIGHRVHSMSEYLFDEV